MDWQAFYERHEARLEDFWARRESGPGLARDFTLFGRPARMTSNDERILRALDYSLPLFSTLPRRENTPFSLHIAAREAPVDPGPFPEDGFEHLQYTGTGTWLAIQLGAWGHCQIDLEMGHARGVLVPGLASRPDLVSYYLLNTVLTNFVIGAGFAMLHCTALLRDGELLLLMAPHNSGKSTTALRLVMAGYRLLSDSQIYISPDDEELLLLGFPVGRIRLRADMVQEFPRLLPHLERERVRDETKYTVNLRRLEPSLVYTDALRPRAIKLCLLERGTTRATTIRPASRGETLEAAFHNSIFYDSWERWQKNLALIERCIARSTCHHLTIGSDPEGIIREVDRLMSE